MKNISPKYLAFVIIACCFISRIPQLTSPHLFLDGDECLVGVMAKHIYEGKEFPLYFWGQQYGLSVIECLFIIPFYAFLGITTLSVKIGMLCLWTTGILFLYKNLQLFSGKNYLLPFLLTMLFIWHPAWAIWSMKARGGYITAFVLSNLVIYLLYHPRHSQRLGAYILSGIAIALVYEAQRFWLGGLIPLVLYRLFTIKRLTPILLLGLSTSALAALFHLHKMSLHNYYTDGIRFPAMSDITTRILWFPKYLYITFHGNYYFSVEHTPSPFCIILSVLFSLLVVFLCAAAIYFSIAGRKGNELFICSVLFVPLCFACCLAFPEINGRYLLPLSGFAILSLQIILSDARFTNSITAVIVLAIAAGVPALVSFRNFELLDDRKALIKDIIEYFRKHDVSYVYSRDLMLSWEIAFYSHEDIIARMPGCGSRYRPYDERVNTAFFSGKNTAIIYRYWDGDEYHFPTVTRIGMYKIGISPSEGDIRANFCLP